MFTNVAKNLEILAEECAEVIQIKSKIIRFGIDDFHPKNELPNREALERELGHVLAMKDILIKNGVITEAGVEAGRTHKLGKLERWYGEGNGAIDRNVEAERELLEGSSAY